MFWQNGQLTRDQRQFAVNPGLETELYRTISDPLNRFNTGVIKTELRDLLFLKFQRSRSHHRQ